MSNTVIDSRISVSAIRKANQKRIGRRYIATESRINSGEIYVRYSSGFAKKEVVITKEQISSAYRNALHKNAKKI